MTKFLKGMQFLAAILVIAFVAVVTAHLMGATGVVLAAAFIGWPNAQVGGIPQKRDSSARVAFGLTREFCLSWAKATTDGNGTIYFLAEIPSDAIITSLLLNNDALSGASSADLGLYKIDKSLSNLGTVSQTASDYYAGCSVAGLPNSTPVDAGAIFMSAVDISAGKANGSEQNGLANLDAQTITSLGATTKGMLGFGLKVWELLGFTDPKWKDDSYVIGLRLNTAGSAAGNLVLRGRWVQG